MIGVIRRDCKVSTADYCLTVPRVLPVIAYEYLLLIR